MSVHLVLLVAMILLHTFMYHAYYNGDGDNYILLLPMVPTQTDSWESYQVLHYCNTTKISNSSTWLTFSLCYKTTPPSLVVEPFPI